MVILVSSLIGIVVFGVANNTFNQYFSLQKDSVQFGDLALQSQKIAGVLRGISNIDSVDNNDLNVYAYFSPNDTFVSLVHYYLNTPKTTLYADVTHMTANPPNGSLITSSKLTYTIVDNFYYSASVNTFEYLDASGTNLSLPISDLNIIKGIRVNLAVPSSGPISNSHSTITTMVSLRNRKTNL
jgi:hypothetical protein